VPPVRKLIAGVVIRNARVTVVRAETRRRGGAGVVDLDEGDWEARDPGRGGTPGDTSGAASPYLADGRGRGGPDPKDPGRAG
jgi:UPF0716 protein FxsA